ncbi:unnamed protein product [Auanema sp. JU1783]|nr:unnamed protein product [Auanema sp. JU1783]
MIDEEWENKKRISYFQQFPQRQHNPHNPHSRHFVSNVHFDPSDYQKHQPINQRYSQYDNPSSVMLRTRQFPEVAGIFGCDDQPALRRFVRFNNDNNSSLTLREVPSGPIQQSTTFSKSSRKPSFFTGNWTFREKKSTARPSIDAKETFRRDERPVSINLSDFRGFRSRSETSGVRSGRSDIFQPINERQSVDVSTNDRIVPNRSSYISNDNYTTRIVLDDAPVAVLRSKDTETKRSPEATFYLRKSCPDLDAVGALNSYDDAKIVIKKRNRRAKEKAAEAKWRFKAIQEWCLDDVLLWLQHLHQDEVASLLIGYDLKGEDLLSWDDQCLTQLGVNDASTRSLILTELKELRERGPMKAEKKMNRTLFDLVKQTSYDQVLAVETPLTPRDITVTHGRLGCLQITKVNGSNLALKEHDCLLEINERSGDQFKSALMLTKLITSSNGQPIRFVVLRRQNKDISDDSAHETSSSGVSSSPQSPIE